MKYEGIFVRNPANMRSILKEKTVGIAGCGGLGSNLAISLVRSGIGKLIIADYDIVEESNLNRQFYFYEDFGRSKVDAIQKYILQINPKLKIKAIKDELTPYNIGDFFNGVDVMVEAFDLAEKKQWLINTWCTENPDIPLVCGSGVSGYGKSNDLRVVKAGNLYVCGDQTTDSVKDGLCAPRVAIVANMQANTVIEILMGLGENDNG